MGKIARSIRKRYNKTAILEPQNDQMWQRNAVSRVATHHAWLHPTQGWRRQSKITLAVRALSPKDRWDRFIAPTIVKAHTARHRTEKHKNARWRSPATPIAKSAGL